MATAQVDLRCDAGADWQRQIRLRDKGTLHLVPITKARMEIRNTNMQLAMTLDASNGRCLVLDDGATVALHITADDSMTIFATGNYPGQYQAVGYWGIGRSYLYDLFVTYATGVQDRIMRGFFYVDPNITQPPGTNGSKPPFVDTTGISLKTVTPNPIAPTSVMVLTGTGLDKVGWILIDGAVMTGPAAQGDSIMDQTPTMIRLYTYGVSAGSNTYSVYAMTPQGVVAEPGLPITIAPYGPELNGTIVPWQGPVGTNIDIQGTGLTAVTELVFWANPYEWVAPSVQVPSSQFLSQTDTDIHVTVPSLPPQLGRPVDLNIRAVGASNSIGFQVTP